MRGYIFTEKERELAERFLADGTKLNGWTTLTWRIDKFSPQLEEDAELLRQVKEKLTSASKGG